VPPDHQAAQLFLTAFDPHHAIVTRLPVGNYQLPLVAVAYKLPDVAETVRVVITREVSPRQLGAQKVVLVPHQRAAVAVAVSASTPDKDGDGVPDNVDNCPDVANPDQASKSGGAGDACSGSGNTDMSVSLDMAVALDLSRADLTGVKPMVDGGIYNFSYTLPTHQSLYYGSHDTPAATIGFSSNADSATCSHDGVHFAACDSPTTIVFTPDDYNNGATLSIKLQKAGWPTAIETLNPKALMPGLQFFNCDVVLTSNEPTAMFQKQLLANRVLCLADGVAVTDVSAHLDDAGNPVGLSGVFLQAGDSTGMKILGTEGNPAVFSNPAAGGNQGIFIAQDNTVHDMVFSNLILQSTDGNPISFDSNGGNNTFSNIVASTGGSGDYGSIFNSGSNTLYNVVIHVDQSYSSPGIEVGSGATVTFKSGHVYGRDDTNAIWVNGGTLNFDSSTVDNTVATSNGVKAPAVTMTSGFFTVTGPSSITSYSGYAVDLSGNGHLSLTGTTVQGAVVGLNVASSFVSLSGLTVYTNGYGIVLNSSTAAIETTTIARLDQAGTAAPAILVKGSNTLNSARNGNLFCDKNLAGSNTFSGSVVNDAASNGMYVGSFMLTKQANMGVVEQCP
jgi:hypothetical protein